MQSWALLSALVFAVFTAPNVAAVKTHDFKTCSQAGFCRRGRALAERAQIAGGSWKSPYTVDASTIQIAPTFHAIVKNELYPGIKFGIEVKVHEDNVVRVRMDELGGLHKRYDEASSWALIAEPTPQKKVKWTFGREEMRGEFGENFDVVIQYSPLEVHLLRGGKKQIVLNGQGLLNMEHYRKKPEPIATTEGEPATTEGAAPQEGDGQQVVLKTPEANPRAWFEGDKEDDYWEETFSSWTDNKPKGPESLSIDITFPNHGVVYGIPQHATRLALPTTIGNESFFNEPYRLYNADVFEYIASSTMSLYGSIPLMHAHSSDSTVAVFNAVASETWIDVSHKSKKSTEAHWVSESGILDLFLIPGPTPEDVFSQYAGLTGAAPIPPYFSLGYHQCRWNYITSNDIRTVQQRFDEEDMPVDVLWLDIEYSEDHKYFIWDKKNFPDPVEMINDVAERGRKMVVIVDPHVKRVDSYPVYKEAKERGVLVKSRPGTDEYEGWCWSGSSAWIDFFNPNAWEWWKSLFKTTERADGGWSWRQSTEAVHIWNDMNEPSVFNGPEITMPKDNVHYDGWEHRDVHNINGMLYSNLTAQAVASRSDPPKRPFVLTRSFYAGSQRFGAMWTGDNMGTWEHMAVGVKMVLSNNIAGMTFSGSDVGGFFGNPDPEMLVRWYQVGIFAPFLRAHAHLDTKRREPYLLDEPHKGIVKALLRLRYSMLPIWYTLFREASVTGVPVLRPHYVVIPKDRNGFEIDDQYYIGNSLLVKPITDPGVTETTVYIPEDQAYYDYFTHQLHRGSSKGGKNITVPAALYQVPLFIRGGSILPTHERPRRSTTSQKNDPYTLRVALDSKTEGARGELYVDDGETFNHQKGNFIWREFVFEKPIKARQIYRLSNRDLAAHHPDEAVSPFDNPAVNVNDAKKDVLTRYDPDNAFATELNEKNIRVEKIVVLGLKSAPKAVKLEKQKEKDGGAPERNLEWEWIQGVGAMEGKKALGRSSELRIRDPKVKVGKTWSIVIEL